MALSLLSQSAPMCQLQKLGTNLSKAVLNRAIQELSDEELDGLEADLEFHADTGLVGVYMSRMMMLLHDNSSEAA